MQPQHICRAWFENEARARTKLHIGLRSRLLARADLHRCAQPRMIQPSHPHASARISKRMVRAVVEGQSPPLRTFLRAPSAPLGDAGSIPLPAEPRITKHTNTGAFPYHR